ncbi:putative restriction endonuclease [Geoalkalibacter ferrihydriticus]|uniref:HNH endonuclease n=2 Tax=Geoalkalibacter ferrihydriticus TaxID=392333 RepID=A0A0C2DTT8_9BACT|nr:HNH endonuclease [Geoalkalibacter ferrihydriticus]KIH76869.1 HNH endonuclease [Geoalkalibacter ferrihydriticus DSM 17813]SDL46882.1 putative restriction endonuclease [Geoalkalibacter ferrihydriticus]
MTTLETHIKHFTTLNRAPGAIWTDATKRKAPHKPILLLAVLDLVHRGVIITPFIAVTDDLVELNELFNLYWRRIIPLGQTSSIAFPFSRLSREPFWQLVPQAGKKITPAGINNTSSVSYLRKYALGAKLDEDLFQIMLSGEGREALREALLLSCFSPEAAALLREQSLINREAFDYSRLLEEKAHLPLVQDIVEAASFRPAARDQGFRWLVVKTYDHRCALCGIRIVTPDGHTVVEAAHIMPWSKTRNDDIRNGLALCRTCHWGFDEGMLGVSGSYTVITARTLATDPNVPGLLSMLSGRGIIPPAERDHWPAQEFLGEHRRAWRL